MEGSQFAGERIPTLSELLSQARDGSRLRGSQMRHGDSPN
jgi:hypothetical protein